MKAILRYCIYGFALLGLCSSCKKRLDKRVSLWRMDKIPYGTKYAYENLTFLFPDAIIRTGSHFPVLFRNENTQDTSQILMIIGPLFAPEPDEMRSILRYASNGNQVFISCLQIDDTVFSLLHLKQAHEENSLKDSGDLAILDPATRSWVKFSYPGYYSNAFFSEVDSGYATVIGKNTQGHADFVRMSYANGGAIFIQLDPFAFSNFFLLHKKNKAYYDLALSYIPKETGIVQWSDYFRYRKQHQEFSSFHFLLSRKSFRWAFWITLIMLLLIFVFESKTKQRPMKEIPALRNASEDFVKTVGRLYFQQKNNQNLAVKMISSFLENIRSNYNLSTSVLDEEFARKLSFRTGIPLSEATLTVQMIHESRVKTELSDLELMSLHKLINQFNKTV